MSLWIQWWGLVSALRPACSRGRTFLWMAAVLAAMCIRGDLLGVTSFVRSLGLHELYYDRLLDLLHSPALNLELLTRLWTALVLRFPGLLRVSGRIVLLADGIKVPKAGLKMPAVKKLAQVESNTKPEFIMGHSCQAISAVAGAANPFAVPLAARIHEGLTFTNRDKRTLPRKLVSLLDALGISQPITLVADAYYACRAVALGLLASGSHLVSRVRVNAVAYRLAKPPRKRRRGRPRMYGKKLKLRSLFNGAPNTWSLVESPVYGEKGVQLRYRCVDLLWKPLKRLVRFVLVEHPTRGRITLLCTDLAMLPIDVIRLYGIRFKIELSFKHALRIIGAYAYHFWMKAMDPISPRISGNQYLHHKPLYYREAVRRKLAAYHRHIQLGLIAQGLLQYLSLVDPNTVWSSFRSWLRTIRPGIPPSERVTSLALRAALPDFLASTTTAPAFTKFLLERMDPSRDGPLHLTG